MDSPWTWSRRFSKYRCLVIARIMEVVFRVIDL